MSKGNCQAKLRRFYFDTKEDICKLFIFGGCQGKYLILFAINLRIQSFLHPNCCDFANPNANAS